MSTVILASGSFLKKFVMDKSRLAYKVTPADIDESIYDNLPVAERVRALAEKKCEVVAATVAPSMVVIGADTLTASESGQVFNKSVGSNDPFKAAMELSGQTIHVYTGCCVRTPDQGMVSTTVESIIIYRRFDEATLRRLIKGDDGGIRSGALGVFYDAPGFTLIERIQGSYTGMLGLPMEFIYKVLDNNSN